MKIAFVSDAAFPWHVGGVEKTERMEAEALARTNEVHFFSFMWKGMRKEFTDKKIQYHCSHYLTDNEFYRHKRRSVREAILFSLMVWRLFNYRFDVVQANAFPILHLPVVKFYCRINRCKLVFDVAEVWSREHWIGYLGPIAGRVVSWYANWALSGADAYISNPGLTEKGLVNIGVKKRKIHVFTPIVDDREMRSVKAGQHKGLVVISGRLIKEKRFDKWLGVIKEVSEITKVKAIIVGDGPEKANIKTTINALGLQKVATVRGYFKSKKEIYKLVKSASLLLNMSEREGLSALTLESISLGTPVVLPDYSPIPDMVKEMCVASSEEQLPDVISKIINGDKRKFIRNIKNLDRFKTSNIGSFYNMLFKGMKEKSVY
ncbi:MAG TPA: glycosyltransferase family 4 protein [Candidatus Acidoferrum sp.]|nr:glycosyltransferase family 4 protein [Candidatus Acidoferrum sp.]